MGNLCLGIREAVQGRVGKFLAGLTSQKDEVRRRCRTVLQSEVSMTILLPDEGTFGEFEDSLNADVLDRILDDIEINYVTLTMPLFKFESEFDLGKTLAGMGMPDAFGASADFSGMTGSKGLSISAVFHKAFVLVDEEGHGGNCGHGHGATRIQLRHRAYPGDGQPALYLPYPRYGHGRGPVPGPGDESRHVRINEETWTAENLA